MGIQHCYGQNVEIREICCILHSEDLKFLIQPASCENFLFKKLNLVSKASLISIDIFQDLIL